MTAPTCPMCRAVEDELACSANEYALVRAKQCNAGINIAVDMAIDMERTRRDYWQARALDAERALEDAKKGEGAGGDA